MLPVLRPHPDKPFPVSPELLRAERRFPSKSPTFAINSPNWVASTLTTLTPSAAPSSSAVGGDRKWTCVSAVTQPSSRQWRAFSSGMSITSVSGATTITFRTGFTSKPLLTST